VDLRALGALWWARNQRPRPRRRALALLLAPLALYLGGAAFWGGTRIGGGLGQLDPVAAGRLLWRLPLALGLAGALWEGGCVVDPTPCRPFFISLPTRVLAEALLGLTTPVKRILGALGLAFSLGMAWGRPALLPAGLAYAALALVWTACLERVIHVLAPAGLLRQRAFLGVILGLGAGLAGLAWLGGGAVAPAWVPRLERLWALPGIQLVRFWQTGSPSALAAPLGATLALLAVTASCVARELAEERRPGEALDGGRAWAFTAPWAGVARLQFHQLLASRAGQMRLLMLLLTVVLAKEPELITVGTVAMPRAWPALAAGLTFGSVLVVPLCNLLGFDRGGVRTWWTAPLAARDLLLGKVGGCAAYAALAAPVLLALTAQAQAWTLRQAARPGGIRLQVVPSARPMGPEILALALLLAALFLWWAGSGLARSLRAPWPMPLGSYGVKTEFDEEKVARVGLLLAPLAWMVPLYGAALLLGWGAAAAAMAALALGSAWRFRFRLDAACTDLDAGREAISKALG